MTLHDLLEHLITHGHLKSSRIAPMRTAIKQYAAMLGADPQQCPPEIYHLPETQLRTLIDSKAPPNLGIHALRNLRNNVRFLLRAGIDLKLIARLHDPVQSWRGTRTWRHQRIVPGEVVSRRPFCLKPLPTALASELEAYLSWCGSPYVPKRAARIQKRAISQTNVAAVIGQIAGYAVTVRRLDPESLTLAHLTDPAVIDGYVTWWVARRGKVTSAIVEDLTRLLVIARHWVKDPERIEGLRQIRMSLPYPEAARDKRARWLLLKEIESVGLSIYPLNAKRLRDYPYAAYTRQRVMGPRGGGKHRTFGRTALYVEMSLILRLLVRIPLRQRNIREMRLDRNLLRQRDGTWCITFRGEELKIARRAGREHHITYTFPAELQGLLEEWLTIWRPRLAKPGETLVFMTMKGQPLTTSALAAQLGRITWKFTGIALHPHLIRDIWATEYIKATRDIAGAAYMLGDTVQIVLKHYAHLLDAEAEQRATSWLKSQLM